MRYKDIKDFTQRCEEHPDHQTGMVTNLMIQARLVEEIDELREYIETEMKKSKQKGKTHDRRSAGAVPHTA